LDDHQVAELQELIEARRELARAETHFGGLLDGILYRRRVMGRGATNEDLADASGLPLDAILHRLQGDKQ